VARLGRDREVGERIGHVHLLVWCGGARQAAKRWADRVRVGVDGQVWRCARAARLALIPNDRTQTYPRAHRTNHPNRDTERRGWRRLARPLPAARESDQSLLRLHL